MVRSRIIITSADIKLAVRDGTVIPEYLIHWIGVHVWPTSATSTGPGVSVPSLFTRGKGAGALDPLFESFDELDSDVLAVASAVRVALQQIQSPHEIRSCGRLQS